MALGSGGGLELAGWLHETPATARGGGVLVIGRSSHTFSPCLSRVRSSDTRGDVQPNPGVISRVSGHCRRLRVSRRPPSWCPDAECVWEARAGPSPMAGQGAHEGFGAKYPGPSRSSSPSPRDLVLPQIPPPPPAWDLSFSAPRLRVWHFERQVGEQGLGC